jgi:hypothetical protein
MPRTAFKRYTAQPAEQHAMCALQGNVVVVVIIIIVVTHPHHPPLLAEHRIAPLTLTSTTSTERLSRQSASQT